MHPRKARQHSVREFQIGNEGSKTSFASISQAVSDGSYSFPKRQYSSIDSSVLPFGDGGTTNKCLIELAKEIWKYLLMMGSQLLQNIFQAPRTWRQTGSQESQKMIQWKVLPQTFQRTCQIKGRPEMDLFAYRLYGNQIHTFRDRMQCSKSDPISTFMLSHLFQ